MLDGIRGHHFGGAARGEDQASELAHLIANLGPSPSVDELRALHAAVADDDVLGLVDPLIERLAELQPSTISCLDDA